MGDFTSELGHYVKQELGVDWQAAESCVFCRVAFKDSRLTRSGKHEIKVLQCLHSSCGSCLEESLRNSDEVKCPICDARNEQRSYHKYMCNFAVHQGIDRGKIDEQKGIACDECVESCPAVESCRQCVRNLCVQCGDHHRRSKTTNMHTLVSLAEQHEDKMHRAAFCAEHDDQRLDLFCETCECVCCRLCILGEHEHHAYKLLAGGLVESERDIMRAQIEQLRGLAKKMRERHQSLSRATRALDDDAEASRANLERMKSQVLSAIRQRRRDMLQEVDAYARWHRGTFEQKRGSLTSKMVFLWRAIDFMEKVLARGTNVEILFLASFIASRNVLGSSSFDLHADQVDDADSGLAWTAELSEALALLQAMGELRFSGEAPAVAASSTGHATPISPSRSAARGHGLAAEALPLRDAAPPHTERAQQQQQQPKQQLTPPLPKQQHQQQQPKQQLQLPPQQKQPQQRQPQTQPQIAPPQQRQRSPPDPQPQTQQPRQAQPPEPPKEQPQQQKAQTQGAVLARTAGPPPENIAAPSPAAAGARGDGSGAPLKISLSEAIGVAPVAKQTLRLYDVLQGQAASVARLGGVHAMSDEQLASGGLRRRVAVLGMEGEELGRFRSPCGIAVDMSHIYVADTLNNRIQVFSKADRKLLGALKIPTHGEDGLADPSGLCCAGDGRLVIVQYGLDRVLSVELARCPEPDTLKVVKMQIFAEQFYGPFGVGFSQGRLFIADSCNHRVLVMSLTGHVLFSIGARGSERGQFEYPECLATFADGSVAVSDKDNHRIQVFDPRGRFLNYIPSDWQQVRQRPVDGSLASRGSLSGPMGMVTDRRDRLYVCDCGSHRVQIFTRDGRWLWSSDTVSKDSPVFRSPTGVAIDEDGQVYVASDHCVQVF